MQFDTQLEIVRGVLVLCGTVHEAERKATPVSLRTLEHVQLSNTMIKDDRLDSC